LGGLGGGGFKNRMQRRMFGRKQENRDRWMPTYRETRAQLFVSLLV